MADGTKALQGQIGNLRTTLMKEAVKTRQYLGAKADSTNEKLDSLNDKLDRIIEIAETYIAGEPWK